MAFLNNSGDIILDAVLTDAGRQRMARGEFKIVKFALSDEEINYQLYDSNHPSGSAFSDLEIMQTPILESFTNNTSLMKTKLVSFSRNNILYMPIFRLNNKSAIRTSTHSDNNGYLLTADSTTTNRVTDFGEVAAKGILPGKNLVTLSQNSQTAFIFVDQGLSTGGSPPIDSTMPADLLETAFLIRVDHRLLRMHAGSGEYTALNHSFVDDDAIATYYVSSTNLEATEGPRAIPASDVNGDRTLAIGKEMFDGPLGTRLKLMTQPSINVEQSEALFDELGTLKQAAIPGTTITKYKYIDTLINVVGVTTGYSIDIPIRIIKDKTP